MTSDKAIQIAQDFCRKIGKPVTVPGTATFPLTGFENEYYWLPEWKVRFGGQADVDVVDATGIIALYADGQYSKIHDTTPTGEILSPEEAKQRALALIQATGEQENFGNLTVAVGSFTRHPTAHDQYYVVDTDRMFHGIPYLHEGPTALLSAQTGEAVNVELHLSSPPMTQGAAALSQGQALGVTQAHMVYDQGFRGNAVLHDATLKVVTVPTGPDTGQGPQPQVGRVAWVVRYTGDTWEDDTWVDAQTGRVVGGESASGGYGGPKSPAAVLTLPLRTTLPGVQAVYMRRADPAAKGGWAAIKAAAFDEKDQPKQIAALR